MLQSFFTGLSGMFSFSKSLDNVSNNIANMNTPGYRGKDSFLRSVNGSGGQGYGASLESTSTRLTSGEVRQTGNETDVALTGSGFFVLSNADGELFYTRAGQFRFDEDNDLIDSVTGFNVMALDAAGNLTKLNISEDRIRPAEATSDIKLTGNLSATPNASGDPAEHEISDITIFDSDGMAQTISLMFTNSSTAANPGAWNVSIQDASGAELGTGEIRFGTDSTPLANFNSFSSTLTFSGKEQEITINLGEPGLFGGATQFLSGGSSTLGASVENGHSVLGLSRLEFDDEGVLNFTYSNGDEEKGAQLAIASFSDESKLSNGNGALFESSENMKAEFGRANSQGLGSVQGGSIELSNVDLTQEFADILIVQRGYQASSQVMSVANELIEQLYSSTRR